MKIKLEWSTFNRRMNGTLTKVKGELYGDFVLHYHVMETGELDENRLEITHRHSFFSVTSPFKFTNNWNLNKWRKLAERLKRSNLDWKFGVIDLTHGEDHKSFLLTAIKDINDHG
jgi:hypothetical protein